MKAALLDPSTDTMTAPAGGTVPVSGCALTLELVGNVLAVLLALALADEAAEDKVADDELLDDDVADNEVDDVIEEVVDGVVVEGPVRLNDGT